MKYEYFSKEILKNKSLTDATKVVANHLIHIAGWESDNQLPSNHKLSELLSIDRKTIIESLKTLKEKGIIEVKDDNTFLFCINGIKFEKQDLSNPDVCHMFGDFVKVPQFLNYIDTITPSARIAAIIFFEFNFGLDKNGNPFVKKEKPTIGGVATYYGINKDTFKKRIEKCLKADIFEYKTIQAGRETKKIVGLKCIEWERIWVRKDSEVAQKSLKRREEARIEAEQETEENYEETGEDKVVSSSIEELLDYAANKLPKTGVICPCLLHDVRYYFEGMVEIKGKEYATNYMKANWPNINL